MTTHDVDAIIAGMEAKYERLGEDLRRAKEARDLLLRYAETEGGSEPSPRISEKQPETADPETAPPEPENKPRRLAPREWIDALPAVMTPGEWIKGDALRLRLNEHLNANVPYNTIYSWLTKVGRTATESYKYEPGRGFCRLAKSKEAPGTEPASMEGSG